MFFAFYPLQDMIANFKGGFIPMRFFYKPVLGLLCGAVILFSSCSSFNEESSSQAEPSAPSSTTEPSPPPQQQETLKIGYSKSGGFNPYLLNDTLVLQASDLISEKLVEITPEMGLDYRLASSIMVNGLSVVIQLQENILFADGTPILPQDVVASINAARNSLTYGGSLAHITDVQASGNQVVLTLSRPDSLFAYLCTLPILKESEIASIQPTPSGRYMYNADQTLIPNPQSAFLQPQAPKTIQLIDVDNFDALVSGLSVGSIDLYATTKESITTSMYTSRSTSYNMNHLVFLGVNSGSPFLAQPTVRKAISTALDRQVLSDRAYYGGAVPARGVLHPLYPCVTGKQQLSIVSDIAATRQQMEQLGYTLSTTDGYYRDSNGNRPELRLLVYGKSALKRSAATLIKEQLNEAGFFVILEETDDFTAGYSDKIAKGDFDLYIGEVKLYNNMDMSPFLQNGTVSYGIGQPIQMLEAYNGFLNNIEQAQAFESAFAEHLPWIPLCWRTGTLVVNKQITGMIPSCSNIFYSMQSHLIDS